MIYALRENASHHDGTIYLVELKSFKELDELNATSAHRYKHCGADYARRWVKEGNIHETGLYVDEGRVRYAPDDPEGN